MSVYPSNKNSLPPYPGPYSVGTIDVETPTSELPKVYQTPEKAVTTISFRIFYPSEKELQQTRPVRWLPEPQLLFFASTLRVFGLGESISTFVA